MFNIIGKSKIWFALSLTMIVLSFAALIVWKLDLGIDFKGGSLMELNFTANRPEQNEVNQLLQTAGVQGNIQIQPAKDTSYIIRTEPLDEEIHEKISTELKNKYSDQYREDRFETIGPIIGRELKTKSIWSVIIVLLAIISYIAFAFRKVSAPVESWKYGTAAVMALIHDLIIATGAYTIMSHFMGWQVDSLFITALLTVLGFSVHDTIVTFDRIRELLRKEQHKTFIEIVNDSVNQTITRSLNTTITTLLVLVAIFVFGGPTIKGFVFTLMIGITIGTYSSIFIASPLLVSWFNRHNNS